MIDKDEIEGLFSSYTYYLDYPISEYTYTKVGGKADLLFFPKTVLELAKIRQYATNRQIPLIVLGNSSNLIVRDGGIRGIVVMLEQMNQVQISGAQMTAFAGAKLIEVSELARDASLTGLEFAAGIPGSVGGAVFMNAGAYGGEISDVFISCQVMLTDGHVETWTAEQMSFSYRMSAIQKKEVICVSATFQLEVGNISEIASEMEALNAQRCAKQPLDLPSCGSVFKRPAGYFTGKLIQDAGLQGKILGGAQISEKHAGFIVNLGTATASDYENLIEFIIKAVQEKFGVTLQPEVRIIGQK
ncbi:MULTISPECIES: UDP-N-acetylmuramate dehydrogenase [unclassified Enterococcus]|uniref:UDP-N-acetylmuramate dehydrogenase n=1 Tax=unclassified Enterococcus TaxID=2608891 RepID=UPI001555CFA8|nr:MULTISPECIES: UDP-N-acetylmuramate dehydrogenase [unclassified Enterococcus]MBS7577463.1 UDP-N-acetylmuramate dehydrogenase [Enterococcus sp. MMGLQ5-2]MBS7584869.1 UDP-N-acetylmuramate dehydrogenase [Enterococcus sp. MMGLQ5-1]NPD12724.1 UDP-N-acetylmuramate dehydrogenase [Enterococcus sp. MMGLQ5-1]NPD37295.1 UDP-N-acetylmuramate dehydrogenase [Enterococcus sp. MMGLQ5-2]